MVQPMTQTSLDPRHALDHMLMQLRSSDENSRQHKTLSEETMLGKITDLAAMCPSGTQTGILPRFYQRFCLFLSFHWETIIESGVEEDSRWGSRLKTVNGEDKEQSGLWKPVLGIMVGWDISLVPKIKPMTISIIFWGISLFCFGGQWYMWVGSVASH